MNIQESINNQVNAGFNKDEIINNLKQQGYSEQEVGDATEHMATIPSLENIEVQNAPASGINGKSVFMGILFLGLGISRLAGMRGGNSEINIILGIVLTGFGIVRLIQGFNGK